ncbi:AMP-binding protein [Gordonia sp. X0973]|uniref:AMP-binding protein n=1 Tax=Gordonia sp. X0973 TaxID=2742602 RepID=UPI000F53B977|nr:AMP-binding protein [Gordonia sp. X0973]QKT08468.1 AMP-binding protein [Gordonia sp. X0973]
MNPGPVPSVGDPRSLSELLGGLTEVTDRGLRCGDEYVSWHDHLRDAARIGAALRSLLDPDRPPHVGIASANSVEYCALLAAAVIEGFVVVGLNTTRRGAALARDIVTADCQLVLVDEGSRPLVDDLGLTVPVLGLADDRWTGLVAAQPLPPAVAIPPRDPDDLAMLIFTSGTTGDPKAVRCSMRKFAAPGVMLAQRFGLGPDDVVGLSMPLFHSNATVAGWAVALAAGASIVLRPSFSARGFVADLHRHGVTYANYVGKPLHYILAVPPDPRDGECALRIMYGNEASAADRDEFARRFGCTVVDGFGSTEGGVAISRTPETPADALGPLVAPVAVVDPETLLPAHAGEVGEIVNTAGPGLFDGYYNDADATAERLRGGMYRTGDLGWVDEGGFVHFAGRRGDWARVDGENLGTAPIEAILLRHPDIDAVAVYGVPVEIGDELWAALVAPKLTPDALGAFLAAQDDLGPKQWPSHIRLVDEIPQTATFKTVRQGLRSAVTPPDWSRSPTGGYTR